MLTDEYQPDLFSEISDLDLVQHLLADLHDGLPEKIGRLRHLIDLRGALGSEGTVLSGGETTHIAWSEAEWSFIHGNFIATIMLCQGLAENLLASFVGLGLSGQELPKKILFAETLKRCKERGVLSEQYVAELKRLMTLRNPLSHFRDINDAENLSHRAMSTQIQPEEHLQRDATFAIGLAVRILALPSFRLGPSQSTASEYRLKD